MWRGPWERLSKDSTAEGEMWKIQLIDGNGSDVIDKWMYSEWEGSITSAHFNFLNVKLKGSCLSRNQAERFWVFFPFPSGSVILPTLSRLPWPQKNHITSIVYCHYSLVYQWQTRCLVLQKQMLLQDRLCERGIRSNIRASSHFHWLQKVFKPLTDLALAVTYQA